MLTSVRSKLFAHRYLYLFFLLLLPYTLHPLIETETVGLIMLDISFSLVLIGSMFAVSERLHVAVFSIILLMSAMVLTWSCSVVPGMPIRLAALSVIGLAMTYTAIYVSRNIIRRHDVTNNTIFGSLCIYLIIGYVWSFAYSILEMLHPGSFNIDNAFFLHHFDDQHVFTQMYYFMYYSFMSLTTLGLGDIMPKTPAARVLTVLEAIIGQIYLVVMVSRLIGLHITQLPAMHKK